MTNSYKYWFLVLSKRRGGAQRNHPNPADSVIQIHKQVENDEEQARNKTDESEYAAKNPEQAVNLEYNCGYYNSNSYSLQFSIQVLIYSH